MKTYFLTIIFVSILGSLSFAQVSTLYETKQFSDFYTEYRNISERQNMLNTDIKGSPYLDDEFVDGSIFTVQRMQYTGIMMRYNIYNDNIEFKTPADEIQMLATPEIVEKAVIGDTKLVYSSYSISNKTKKGFFTLLEEGKASLYSKSAVELKEATKPAAYQDAAPARFIKKADEYYIRIGTGQAVIVSNKKDLVAIFPDNQDKIEAFISKNKVKVNKPSGLKEVVRYYNSL